MNFICLDPGHGRLTPGKESPDGTLKEWANNRSLAQKISMIAKGRGYIVRWTVNDDTDPSLSVRAKIANNAYEEFKQMSKNGKGVLVSCHSDAFGDGSVWTTPNGFAVWTTKSSNNSDKLATEIWKSVNDIVAKKYQINMRKQLSEDGDVDYEANFTILAKTNYPCVLIEDLFHTNRSDVMLLKDDEYLWTVAGAIVDGITNYLNK